MTDRHELRLFGHRGSSALLPEGTMAAFHRALEDGANALELDLHCTRDRHLVVSHDASGERMAGTVQLIRELRLAEVKAWDAGAGFVAADGSRPYAGQGLQVPTLVEVLEQLPAVPMSIDLKVNRPDLVEPMLQLIIDHDAAGRVTFASFHDRLVRRARRLGYPGPIALSRLEVAALRLLPLVMARRLVHGQAVQVPPRYGPIRLDRPAFADRCRRLGLRLDYWVINQPARAAELLRLGATGIMSDDPGRLLPVLQGHGPYRTAGP